MTSGSEIKKFGKGLFSDIWQRIFILLIVTLIFYYLAKIFPEYGLVLTVPGGIFGIILGIYIVLSIFYFVDYSFHKLMEARNLGMLALYYLAFIFTVILIFSMFYAIVEGAGFGYLKYGECDSEFNMIDDDFDSSNDYFYFSAITFFAVGYGDICPMGLAKGISVLNAFVGNFIAVVIMVLVVSYYVKRKKGK
jgi:potassium channel LctB